MQRQIAHSERRRPEQARALIGGLAESAAELAHRWIAICRVTAHRAQDGDLEHGREIRTVAARRIELAVSHCFEHAEQRVGKKWRATRDALVQDHAEGILV